MAITVPPSCDELLDLGQGLRIHLALASRELLRNRLWREAGTPATLIAAPAPASSIALHRPLPPVLRRSQPRPVLRSPPPPRPPRPPPPPAPRPVPLKTSTSNLSRRLPASRSGGNTRVRELEVLEDSRVQPDGMLPP